MCQRIKINVHRSAIREHTMCTQRRWRQSRVANTLATLPADLELACDLVAAVQTSQHEAVCKTLTEQQY